MSAASLAFASFMASPAGRLLRIAAGAAVVAFGWANRAGTSGLALIGVGVVLILVGLVNVCLIGPIIGAPLMGSQLRR